MKRGLLAAAMALTTALGFAQTVTFTNVLAVEDATSSGSVRSSNYVPVADKFIVSNSDQKIEIFNGVTGAREGQLSQAGIATSPGGLGFFALTATRDGYIYGWEDLGDDIYRWSSTTDLPTKVYDNAPFARFGSTGTDAQGKIAVAFTGVGNFSFVQFYSDSFPFASGSFSFTEAPDLDGKSGLAINNNGTIAYTVGDTNAQPLKKWVKTGTTWAVAPEWPTTLILAGPMAYDEVNNILLVHDMRGAANRRLVALHGTTGAEIGTATLPVLSGTTAGNSGAYVAPTAGGGTLWVTTPAATANRLVLYKWTYAVDTSSVDDWSLYQQ